MDDLISRQAAIDALTHEWDGMVTSVFDVVKALPSAQPEPLKITIDHAPTPDELERLKQAMRNTPIMLFPSAQPEITLESAIDYLHSIGWMQEHDSILSSAQPEDCDTCKHGYFGDDQCERCRVRYPSHYERRTDGQVISE